MAMVYQPYDAYLAALRRYTPPVAEDVPIRARRVTPSRVLVAAAFGLWGVSLGSLRSAHTSSYGLLFAASPAFAAAVAVTVLAFCLAVRSATFSDTVLSLLAFVVLVRVTVSVITPRPLYVLTYQRLGGIAHIQATGHVEHGATLATSWPAAASALAWFSSLTGVSSLALAHWFPVAVHGLVDAAIFVLCRAVGQSREVASCGAFIAEAANWMGQDDLSPQTMAFVLSLAVLVLLVQSRRSVVAGWLSLPIFAAVTAMHELTPYWLIVVAVLLGIGGFVRPRWIGGVYAVIALAWLARNLAVARAAGLRAGFDPLANDPSSLAHSAGRTFTVLVVTLPALLIWGTVALIAVVQLSRSRDVSRGIRPVPDVSPWLPLIIAGSAVGLLAGQSLGSEAVYRVLLYSIPGCVLLLAPICAAGLAYRSPWADRRHRLGGAAIAILSVGLTLVLSLSSLQGYYGGWFSHVVSRDSPAATGQLTAPTGHATRR